MTRDQRYLKKKKKKDQFREKTGMTTLGRDRIEEIKKHNP